MKTKNTTPKHTPGPWKVASDLIPNDDLTKIAEIKNSPYAVFCDKRVISKEEAEANAQLIAAAPEMHLFLLEQEAYYRKHYEAGVLSDEGHEKWNRVKAIIKKATGQ